LLPKKLPWGHTLVLIDRLKANSERLWYDLQTIEHGWSYAVLQMQIETRLLSVGPTSNGKQFQSPLLEAQSDMALEVLKYPYIFDFLSVGEKIHEREIERELVQHITKFLLGIGSGFPMSASKYI